MRGPFARHRVVIRHLLVGLGVPLTVGRDARRIGCAKRFRRKQDRDAGDDRVCAAAVVADQDFGSRFEGLTESSRPTH